MEPDKVKRAPNVMALVSHFNQVRSACGWRASSSVLLMPGSPSVCVCRQCNGS